VECVFANRRNFETGHPNGFFPRTYQQEEERKREGLEQQQQHDEQQEGAIEQVPHGPAPFVAAGMGLPSTLYDLFAPVYAMTPTTMTMTTGRKKTKTFREAVIAHLMHEKRTVDDRQLKITAMVFESLRRQALPEGAPVPENCVYCMTPIDNRYKGVLDRAMWARCEPCHKAINDLLKSHLNIRHPDYFRIAKDVFGGMTKTNLDIAVKVVREFLPKMPWGCNFWERIDEIGVKIGEAKATSGAKGQKRSSRSTSRTPESSSKKSAAAAAAATQRSSKRRKTSDGS
jgi:hypothetical protein